MRRPAIKEKIHKKIIRILNQALVMREGKNRLTNLLPPNTNKIQTTKIVKTPIKLSLNSSSKS
jgi:hypothetical protein